MRIRRNTYWINGWASNKLPRGCSIIHHIPLADARNSKIATLATILFPLATLGTSSQPNGLHEDLPVEPLLLSDCGTEAQAVEWNGKHLGNFEILAENRGKFNNMDFKFPSRFMNTHEEQTGARVKNDPGGMRRIWKALWTKPSGLLMSWNTSSYFTSKAAAIRPSCAWDGYICKNTNFEIRTWYT